MILCICLFKLNAYFMNKKTHQQHHIIYFQKHLSRIDHELISENSINAKLYENKMNDDENDDEHENNISININNDDMF